MDQSWISTPLEQWLLNAFKLETAPQTLGNGQQQLEQWLLNALKLETVSLGRLGRARAGEQWLLNALKIETYVHDEMLSGRLGAMTMHCDFCFFSAPKWSYPCKDFVALDAGPIGAGSKGDWAACDVCSEFIEKGDWDGLIKRVGHSFHLRYPMIPVDEVMVYFQDIYKKFRANRTGHRNLLLG